MKGSNEKPGAFRKKINRLKKLDHPVTQENQKSDPETGDKFLHHRKRS